MITTVTTTTTTTTTTVVAAHFATIAGVIAVLALIAFLIIKELSSASDLKEADADGTGASVGRFQALAAKSNIAIFSLLFVFAAIVVTRVLEILG